MSYLIQLACHSNDDPCELGGGKRTFNFLFGVKAWRIEGNSSSYYYLITNTIQLSCLWCPFQDIWFWGWTGPLVLRWWLIGVDTVIAFSSSCDSPIVRLLISVPSVCWLEKWTPYDVESDTSPSSPHYICYCICFFNCQHPDHKWEKNKLLI